jgi:hypothetical protein
MEGQEPAADKELPFVGDTSTRTPHGLDLLRRSLTIVLGELSSRASEGADIIILVPVRAVGLREYRRGWLCVADGEAAVERAWPQVVATLPWLATQDEIEFKRCEG